MPSEFVLLQVMPSFVSRSCLPSFPGRAFPRFQAVPSSFPGRAVPRFQVVASFISGSCFPLFLGCAFLRIWFVPSALFLLLSSWLAASSSHLGDPPSSCRGRSLLDIRKCHSLQGWVQAVKYVPFPVVGRSGAPSTYVCTTTHLPAGR